MIAPLVRLASARPTRAAVNAGFAAWSRRRVAKLAAADPGRVQRATLRTLVHQAASTRFGRDHRFDRVRTVEDFRRAVPLRSYEDLWADYLREAYPAFDDLTWPGRVPYLALTSGTTQGATKYIPVSRAMIASNFKASRTMLAHHVAHRGRSGLFGGRMLFLGGSTALEPVGPGVSQGDLSGIVAREAPDVSRPYTFPPLSIALEADWDRKLQRLAEASVDERITLIGGVPSWLLALFDRVRTLTGKATIAEVWPSLEVVVHGGVKFDPYRRAFAEALGSPRVALQDAYACSEGFLGFGDPAEPSLLIPMFDHGVYVEFVPVEDLSADRPARHDLSEVEVGVNYAVVVSTCAGLWGHVVGDTVRFERRDRPRMVFTGRTKQAMSAFGEHLIGEEVEAAMAEAAEFTNAIVRDWHLGPVFRGALGHHRFVVEFAREPGDLAAFRDRLDGSLKRRNADYLAHRADGVGLPPPSVIVASPGAFESWLRSRGKLGGQHKMPRMDASGTLTAEIVARLEAGGFLGARVGGPAEG